MACIIDDYVPNVTFYPEQSFQKFLNFISDHLHVKSVRINSFKCQDFMQSAKGCIADLIVKCINVVVN
jgi:hypothetical protein